jgi:Hemerythrin HHE cation binding domain
VLEKLLLQEKHAISILINDHDKVKELFDGFKKTESSGEKEKIIAEALTELKIHAAIEEEIFYPAVREQLGRDLMNEARRRASRRTCPHCRTGSRCKPRRSQARQVHGALRERSSPHQGRRRRDAPKAKGLDLNFEALGEQMLARKKELKRDGIPDDAEHTMVAAVQGRGDSAAACARRTTGKKAAPSSGRRKRAPRDAPSEAKVTTRKTKRARGRVDRESSRCRH